VGDWRLPEARVRAALWEAEGHFERREYFAAASALERVFGVARDESRELVRGLYHLAAAGYKAQSSEPDRARRQLAHAKRRLEGFLPEAEEIPIARLVTLVERDVP
jgi:hypothetical protein